MLACCPLGGLDTRALEPALHGGPDRLLTLGAWDLDCLARIGGHEGAHGTVFGMSSCAWDAPEEAHGSSP